MQVGFELVTIFVQANHYAILPFILGSICLNVMVETSLITKLLHIGQFLMK